MLVALDWLTFTKTLSTFAPCCWACGSVSDCVSSLLRPRTECSMDLTTKIAESSLSKQLFLSVTKVNCLFLANLRSCLPERCCAERALSSWTASFGFACPVEKRVAHLRFNRLPVSAGRQLVCELPLLNFVWYSRRPKLKALCFLLDNVLF